MDACAPRVCGRINPTEAGSSWPRSCGPALAGENSPSRQGEEARRDGSLGLPRLTIRCPSEHGHDEPAAMRTKTDEHDPATELELALLLSTMR